MENKADTLLWFDLDDTLWDMTGNSVICLREIYHRYNLSRYFSTSQEWDSVYHDVNRLLWEQYGRGDITRDYLRAERFARPLRMAGADEPEASRLAAELDTVYLQLLGDKTGLMPHAAEVLAELSARGYTMGIVSNGFREVQYRKLASGGIGQYFSTVVLSDDVGVNKPHPGFFSHAERCGAPFAAKHLIVGDNFEADIIGALRAGWQAVWYNPASRPMPAVDTSLSSRLSVITSLTQLPDILP